MSRNKPINWRDWSASLPWHGGAWHEWVDFERLSYRSTFEHLIAVRRAGALSAGDLPLICVLRNEAARLPVFFEHYRKLGITRFIMIDNNSDDGSHDMLLAERSADVFFTHARFTESQSGLYWANGLAHALCRGHWTLRVDVDELLVYDGMEEHGLADLARLLDASNRDRLFAPMRDVYSSSPLAGQKCDIAGILESDCWFDSEGYVLQNWREGWQMIGGPRQRLFGQGPEAHPIWLSKYPFFRVTEKTCLVNHHYLWPLDKTRHDPMGALLHIKMLGDFAERSKSIEREGQHWNESRAYRIINRTMKERPEMTAFHENSRRYEGPRSFIRFGLMQAIDWSA